MLAVRHHPTLPLLAVVIFKPLAQLASVFKGKEIDDFHNALFHRYQSFAHLVGSLLVLRPLVLTIPLLLVQIDGAMVELRVVGIELPGAVDIEHLAMTVVALQEVAVG